MTMALSDLAEGRAGAKAETTHTRQLHGTRARVLVLRIRRMLELAAGSSARCRGDERGAAADDSAVGAGGGLGTGRSQAALTRLFHDHSPAHPRKARRHGTVRDVLVSKGPLIFALRLGVLAGERLSCTLWTAAALLASDPSSLAMLAPRRSLVPHSAA